MMRELLYIYKVGETYQLRECEEHMVLTTSSDREELLDKVSNIVKRYHSKDRILKEISKSELSMNRDLINRRSKEYLELDMEGELQEGLRERIIEALKEVREDSKVELVKLNKIKVVRPKKESKKSERKPTLRKQGLVRL